MPFTLKWWKAAGIRALKTFAQTAVSFLAVDKLGLTDVDWLSVLSAAALAGIVSLLTSLAGLPEVDKE